jgi:acetyl-CoA synthetase (ADP-forming)/acetyltransferase
MVAVSRRVPRGRRLGFLGAGGGTSVLFTDLACENGMVLPELQEGTQKKIAAMIRSVNTSTTNPVDLGFFGFDFNVMANTMLAMDGDDRVDVVVPYVSIDFISTYQTDQIESGPHVLVEAARRMRKPVIPILSQFTEDDLSFEEVRVRIFKILRDAGMPVFKTIQDCIHALAATSSWTTRHATPHSS